MDINRFFFGLIFGIALFLLLSIVVLFGDVNPSMRVNEPTKKLKQYEKFKRKWRIIPFLSAPIYAAFFTALSFLMNLEVGIAAGFLASVFWLFHTARKQKEAQEKEWRVLHHLLERGDKDEKDDGE